MANFTWTNAAGGDWSVAGNWSPLIGAPPGAGDSATLAGTGTSYTVDVTTAIDVDTITFNSLQAINIAVDAGGLLNVAGDLTTSAGAEEITIAGTGAGGDLELGNLFGVGLTIEFAFANAGPTSPNAGIIQFDNVPFGPDAVFEPSVTSVALGDEFVLTGANFSDDSVTYDGTTLTVVDAGLPDPGSSVGDPLFKMTNVSLQSGFTGDFEIVNGDTIQAVCYVRGTMIHTPAGEVPVETLRPGMQVITLVDGHEIPRTVKWVGHRRIDLTKHPRSETVAPIRVERDAFADNVPHRDLLLSPDHAVLFDGKLICVRQLVNGSTVRGERGWTAVDYYHVEFDRHAILLAEGLTVESYLDTGNRAFFANSGMTLVLHPDLPNENRYPTREAGSCAPFVSDEASVRPVWQGVADRAATIGRVVPARETTVDADPQLQCLGGRTVAPIHRDGDRAIFALPRDVFEVRLISRAQAPTEARPWLEDRRRLGVCVKRIVLRCADETHEIAMDHPDLTRGWWAVERDRQTVSRWTDGAAVLPLPPMPSPVLLEIHLAGAMTYVEDAVPTGGTETRAA